MNIVLKLGPDCSMRMGSEEYLPVAEVEKRLSQKLSDGLTPIIASMREGQYLWLNASVVDTLDQLPESHQKAYLESHKG
jgi:hypothetical protein